jgi:hypothetical protein
MQTLIVALFAVFFGAAICFWGYRVFLVLLPVWGFFAGLWIGLEATQLLFGEGFLATTTGLVAGFLFGLVLAVLSYLFYFIGVALVAAGIGAALGAGVMSAFFGLDSGFLVGLVTVTSALVVLVLVLLGNLQKYVIIVLTALAGGNLMVLSLLLLLGQVSVDALQSAGNSVQLVLGAPPAWTIIWLAIAIMGVIAQVRLHRNYKYDRRMYVGGWS